MLATVLSLVSGVLCIAVFALWRGKASLDEKLRHEVAARATAQATLTQIEQYYEASKQEAAQAQQALSVAERNAAVANQKVESAEQRIREFEQLKGQFEQFAKAAALETGNQLSNKLLEDHKREREQTHEQFKNFTKTATETLAQKQQELATVLGTVQGQVNDSRTQLSTLVRAMQNPIGAGAEGEIVMSNILAQHGFTLGQDYELQVDLRGDDGILRPDCVIYLPHQHAIIVDSKASQHIFALFRAEGTAEFDTAFRDIQTTMRAHAKALGGKTYQESLRKLKNRNGEPITRTTLVMFIPNDEVVTRLMQKDPNLMQYLRENDIVLAGPVTLSGLFLAARALVREAKQKDEQHAILEMTQDLMSDILAALKHADKVLGGIKNSAEAFAKFSASINRGLSRMRKIRDKGLSPSKNSIIPSNMPRYEVVKSDDVLQGESEELVEVLSITKEDAA